MFSFAPTNDLVHCSNLLKSFKNLSPPTNILSSSGSRHPFYICSLFSVPQTPLSFKLNTLLFLFGLTMSYLRVMPWFVLVIRVLASRRGTRWSGSLICLGQINELKERENGDKFGKESKGDERKETSTKEGSRKDRIFGKSKIQFGL